MHRQTTAHQHIIGDLRKGDFELISVSEPDLLQDDPTRILMRQVFGPIAQYEKAMIVAKLRGARERMKAKKGRCEGRKPYGFYEGEQEIVERMKALRAQSLGFDRIGCNGRLQAR